MRMLARGSQWRLFCRPFSRTRRTRIVELVVLAKATDAAHRCAALLDGEESAIRAASAFVIAVHRAPGVGIVFFQGRGGCKPARQNYEDRETAAAMHFCLRSH